MERRIPSMMLVWVLLLGLGACGQSTSEQADSTEHTTWQDYYDLGVRYLSEGDYQEAIIAFTAAIEIDPKQALAYVGRGDAYVGIISTSEVEMQDTIISEYYNAAEADYLAAIDIDPTAVDIYLKLAEIYLAMDEIDLAISLLQTGYMLTADEHLYQMLDNLTATKVTNEINDNKFGQTEFTGRESYYNFSDLPLDVQAYIEAMVPAIVANDIKSLRYISDVSDPASFPNLAYTFWNGYKIQSLGLPNREYELKTNIGTGSTFGLEIRPKDGMGYYCTVYSSVMNNEIDYNRSGITRAYCNCTNWQYNGTMQYEELCSVSFLGEIVDIIDTTYTGNIVEGLFEGDFLRKQNFVLNENGPGWYMGESTETFEGGIGYSPNRSNRCIGYINLYGIFDIFDSVDGDYIRETYEQYLTDRLYW